MKKNKIRRLEMLVAALFIVFALLIMIGRLFRKEEPIE